MDANIYIAKHEEKYYHMSKYYRWCHYKISQENLSIESQNIFISFWLSGNIPTHIS